MVIRVWRKPARNFVLVLWRLVVKWDDPLLQLFGKVLYVCIDRFQLSDLDADRKGKRLTFKSVKNGCCQGGISGLHVIDLLQAKSRVGWEHPVCSDQLLNEWSCRWRSGCGRPRPCLIRLVHRQHVWRRWSWLVRRPGPDKWIQSDSELKMETSHLIYLINPQGLSFCQVF